MRWRFSSSANVVNWLGCASGQIKSNRSRAQIGWAAIKGAVIYRSYLKLGRLPLTTSDCDVNPQGDTHHHACRPVCHFGTSAHQFAVDVVERIPCQHQHDGQRAQHGASGAIAPPYPRVAYVRAPQHAEQVQAHHGGGAVELHAPREREHAALTPLVKEMERKPDQAGNQQHGEDAIHHPPPSGAQAEGALAHMVGKTRRSRHGVSSSRLVGQRVNRASIR